MSSNSRWWKLTQAIAWAYYRSDKATSYAKSLAELRLLRFYPHFVDDQIRVPKAGDVSAAAEEIGIRTQFLEALLSGKLRTYALDDKGGRFLMEPLVWQNYHPPETHPDYEKLFVGVAAVRQLWPSDNSAPDWPPVSNTQLEGWWASYRQSIDVYSMSEEKRWSAAKAAFPGHKISRRRVRDLIGSLKRGRKPIRG